MVTALFCDLVGFTPLSERLDPEEVRDLQDAYFKQMRQQIERYGGTVEKYAGDAVLALFGAPVAHEDDAERAVMCALGMQHAIEPVAAQASTRWEVEPAIRIGVNTGEVVSGFRDAGGRQDVAVTGDAVNTAARLQAASEPGQILVGAETMQLTQRRIVYGERCDLVLKGKEGTVPAYAALGLREQMGERWEEREHLTPLVGRQRELAQLTDAWVRAHAGEGQLVTLVGDAGVGKSRLISELVGKAMAGAAIRVVRGRCLSYGQEVSLWLIADLLRGFLGIREQERLEEVRLRLQTAVTSLLAGQDRGMQADAIDVLGEVLGLPPGNSLLANAGAQVRRQALIRSLRLVLAALSERAQTVMLLEDLHWIDAASQEVLTEVLADVPGLRLLALAAQRPGWIAPWSEWSWPERLTVRPLADRDAAVLAEAVLGGTDMSEELEHYVAVRAGGNPFFVEEMLHALQEAGDLIQRDGKMHLVKGAVERLPSTLTEVLLARLDRLDTEVRALTQIASVIGRSFEVRLLASVTGQEIHELELPLASLQRAEIAFPRRAPDLEYVFKHVSMREVAYNTLVSKRRQVLHLATARAIAQLYPADEYVEMIAYHYARTEEHAEAAAWLEKAGDRAAAIYANDTAIGNYQEARERLKLAAAEPTVFARLDEKLGAVLHTVARFDQALDVLEQAVEVYQRARDGEAVGRVTARIGRVHRDRGTVGEGIARLEPLLNLLDWSGPSRGLASVHVALAHLYFAGGRYRDSMQAAERASETARAIGDDGLLAAAEMRRGTALHLVGEVEQGGQILESAVQLAESVGDLDTLSIAVSNLGELYFEIGALERGKMNLERSLELAERVGELASMGYSLVMIGWLLYYLGEWDHAKASIDRGAEVIRSVGSSWYSAYPPLQTARLQVAQGDWEDAARNLNECLAIAEPIGDIQALQGAHRLLGELEVLEGRPEAARTRLEPLKNSERLTDQIGLLATLAWAHLELGAVDQADEIVAGSIDTANLRQNKPLLPEALRVLGMVRARQGRWNEAQTAFEEAISLARGLPCPYVEARALVEYGITHVHHGELEQAGERLGAAMSIFRRLGAKKDVERTGQVLRELEVASPKRER